MKPYDVIVVGAGNAAHCAALSAQELGARVVMLERSPQEQRGGNSSFTGGGFRMVFHGLEDIKQFVPDLSKEEQETSDFGEYTAEQYLDDMGRVTQYYTDPDLTEILVNSSAETVHWIRGKGVRFVPEYGRRAFKHNGRWKFLPGFVLAAIGGGRGLVEAYFKATDRMGIPVRYDTQATSLIRDRTGILGVRVLSHGVEEELYAKSIVLACGGFEANREWRTRYLGPGWDLAKVRGSRYNTGDGLRMALDVGAQSYGQWSGCHSVAWDRYAPDFGDINSHTSAQRHSYPFSIMVNGEGKRFLDEGADFRALTYAKYGRIVLEQPGNYAWQIFDSVGSQYLRDDYRMPGVTKVKAETMEELVTRMEDVNASQFLETVREFNTAIRRDVVFDPNIKDGRCTVGLAKNKSNWANPIEKPPFEAYAVGTGITFTFGGIKIDTTGRALDVADSPLPGLYAAGEIVGGIFYFNYPGAAGLMAGAVFGRIAGRGAAHYALAEGTT